MLVGRNCWTGLFRQFGTILSCGAVVLIRVYQLLLGPILGGHCRFYPSCSHYACQAILTHGFWIGCWLSFKRLLRCNPFSSKWGWDPVPNCSKSNNY